MASQQLVIQDLATQVANLSSRLLSLVVALPSGMASSASGSHMAIFHKLAPVEFGRFNDSYPDAWIFQADRYFDFYGIIVEHKLTLASFYLDDEEVEWYQWLYRNKQLKKGLCFNYDEKFSAGHCFKTSPQLLHLSYEAEDPLLMSAPEMSNEVIADELQYLEVQAHSTTSYYSLTGGITDHVICLTRHVTGSPVQVFVDGGSTHNFIQSRVAKFLQLLVIPVSIFSVVVVS
ncbi:hypothetical protein R3W88_034148 [Solanum pinnatisectum]|uniref:Uncharacterized protein n=1 Tax=Solanum pinnatisectum TaxID=50273 RepID=A0AAV9K113_9SOLN|nr:hypothetical protein R3W88_034148 [Solanum pinnatisectum]